MMMRIMGSMISKLIMIIAMIVRIKKFMMVKVGRDGALAESITFNRRVVCSTPALAVT